MSEEVFLGLDIGTTSLKLAAFDVSGELKFQAGRATPYTWKDEATWLEPEKLETSLTELLRSLDPKLTPLSLGISSFAETVMAIDDEKGLYPGLAWYDESSKPQAEIFGRLFSREYIRDLAARSTTWMAAGPHILKFKEDAPERYAHTRFFLDVASFALFRLSGEIFGDRGLACRSLLYNLAWSRWAPEIFKGVDIDLAKMPPLKNSGELWGVLNKEWAEKTGLPQGLPLSSGGLDHAAAAFGARIRYGGEALLSLGTVGVFYTPAKAELLKTPAFLKDARVCGGHAVFPGLFYILNSITAGGYCVDWFIHKVLGRDYDIFDKMEPKRGRAMFWPQLRPSTEDLPPGAFYCLSDKDNGETLLQAVVEGLAFECRHKLEELFAIKGEPLRRFTVLGGGAKNKFLMRILAHLFEMPVQSSLYPYSEATLGAAMAGGLAAGIFKSEAEADALWRPAPPITPSDHDEAHYLAEKYQRYVDQFYMSDPKTS